MEISLKIGRSYASAPAPVRAVSSPPARLAVDPICGMTVAAIESTPSIEHEGETIYFCCEGCKATFQAQHLVA